MLWWVRLSIIVSVLFAVSASYFYAYRAGVNSERSASLERSIDTLRERAKTNEEIRSMDDAELCIALGGRMQDGSCS